MFYIYFFITKLVRFLGFVLLVGYFGVLRLFQAVQMILLKKEQVRECIRVSVHSFCF